MVAEGAIRAGCRFFAGDPITPATGIFKAMIDALPARGGLALSAPDEISAIAECIGAAMRGYKAMTATSGPGWALMIESVQYALMTETPLVIALVQRLGPSTGGATQGAQGDLLLAEHATSGGYTIPMLAPSNARECADLTEIAFAWAERLRTPVVVLSDKEVGMTTERVDFTDGSSSPETYAVGTNGNNGTYYFNRPGDIPLFTAVGGATRVIATGSAHDKRGKLQKNSPETIDVLRHLEEKIRLRAHELEIVVEDIQPEARTLVISYGVTSRAASSAVRLARDSGLNVSHLSVKSLFPLPYAALDRALKGVESVIVPEENLTGQYRRIIAPYIGNRVLRGINKIGNMISPSEILRAIRVTP
ncbi:MAG: hypothetical protein A2X67_02045 [Ignavibacteria bacterium GWA2_55_11]|nr:MAG: hypothetical protein A2X67_02045 [Ignavibacteria bacterium GWA2_55_11]